LEEMKDRMYTQFGNEVFEHFENKHKGLLRSHSKRRENKSDDYDEETEYWLADVHTTDKEGVLEPGFTELFTVEAIKGTDSTIHEEDTNKKSNESTHSDESATTSGSASTGVSEYSTTSSISWMQQPESKCSSEWREGSRVQKKLDKAQITSTELSEWKNDNKAKMEILTEANEGNLNTATKQAIICTTIERKRYREAQQQESNTGTAAAESPGRKN